MEKAFDDQCLEFLNLVLRVKEEEEEALIERGGVPGGSNPLSPVGSGTVLTLHHKTLISKLLAIKPVNPDLLSRVIPPHLPDHLRQNVEQIDYSSLSSIFDMDAAARLVAENRLTNREVLSGYLQSIRNMYEYELSDEGIFHLRLLKYFARIFTEVVERFCPSYNGHISLVSVYVRLHTNNVRALSCIWYTMALNIELNSPFFLKEIKLKIEYLNEARLALFSLIPYTNISSGMLTHLAAMMHDTSHTVHVHVPHQSGRLHTPCLLREM